VGRLVVLEHRPFNRHTGSRAALFDRFECVDDPPVAGALFEAAAGWARRRSLERISGPRRLLAGAPNGILVEGFDHPPALGMPYHPPGYGAMIDAAGLIKEADLLSAYIDRTHPIPGAILEAADAAAARHGLQAVAYPSRRAMWRDRTAIAGLYNQAFAGSSDFCPLSGDELRSMARQMIAIAEPRLISMVKQGDRVAAFLMMLPDVSAGIRRSRGRLLPSGWLRIIAASRSTPLVSLQLYGVLPEFRGTGANLVTYADLARQARVTRFRAAEVVHVAEDNHAMRRNIDLLGGVEWAKRHRLYCADV